MPRNAPKTSRKPSSDPVMRRIRDQHGLGSEIARRLGINRQAITQWQQVPWNRVQVVADVLGVPLHEVRPDIYPAPAVAPSEAMAGETRNEEGLPPQSALAAKGRLNRKVSDI